MNQRSCLVPQRFAFFFEFGFWIGPCQRYEIKRCLDRLVHSLPQCCLIAGGDRLAEKLNTGLMAFLRLGASITGEIPISTLQSRSKSKDDDHSCNSENPEPNRHARSIPEAVSAVRPLRTNEPSLCVIGRWRRKESSLAIPPPTFPLETASVVSYSELSKGGILPLTEDQKKTFLTWLKDHDVPQTCPTCGMTGEWNLYDGILGALDLNLEEQKAKPSSMGFLVLTCKHCMHSRFFAAGPVLHMT